MRNQKLHYSRDVMVKHGDLCLAVSLASTSSSTTTATITTATTTTTFTIKRPKKTTPRTKKSYGDSKKVESFTYLDLKISIVKKSSPSPTSTSISSAISSRTSSKSSSTFLRSSWTVAGSPLSTPCHRKKIDKPNEQRKKWGRRDWSRGERSPLSASSSRQKRQPMSNAKNGGTKKNKCRRKCNAHTLGEA